MRHLCHGHRDALWLHKKRQEKCYIHLYQPYFTEVQQLFGRQFVLQLSLQLALLPPPPQPQYEHEPRSACKKRMKHITQNILLDSTSSKV